jgi:hypothetical protein
MIAAKRIDAADPRAAVHNSMPAIKQALNVIDRDLTSLQPGLVKPGGKRPP